MLYDIYWTETLRYETWTENQAIDAFGLSEWLDILDGKVPNVQAFPTVSKAA